ncbi:MAG: hypothetical protein L6R35_000996, partial [Caloplaca aegaea]
AQIHSVHGMAANAKQRKETWEVINNREKDLNDYDSIDKPTEDLLGEDCMLFHKLGKVVQARSYRVLVGA